MTKPVARPPCAVRDCYAMTKRLLGSFCVTLRCRNFVQDRYQLAFGFGASVELGRSRSVLDPIAKFGLCQALLKDHAVMISIGPAQFADQRRQIWQL